jgi:CYTH domain-containing protein
MPTEIEHKFLVTGDPWRDYPGIRYLQGYLSVAKHAVVRARVGGGKGFITIKGAASGPTRLEYEYEIPESEAREIIERLCGSQIVDKTRYRVPVGACTWEVDEFHGRNSGLVVAEIELQFAGQEFEKPDWIGDNVSEDPRYSNAMLAVSPFDTWLP